MQVLMAIFVKRFLLSRSALLSSGASTSAGRFLFTDCSFSMTVQTVNVESCFDDSVLRRSSLPAPGGKKVSPDHNEIRVDLGLSSEEITSRCHLLLECAKKAYDAVVSIPEDRKTFKNTIQAMALIEGHMSTLSSSLYFPQFVSISQDVRTAAVEANKLIENFYVEASMRQDLYESALYIKENQDNLGPLATVDQRLLDKILLGFRRHGLMLSDEQSKESLKILKKRLSSLCIDFSSNIGEDDTFLLFSPSQLEGVPQTILDSFEKIDNPDDNGISYKVTMKYPDYFGVLKYCNIEETRRLMDSTYSSRCPQNTSLLLEAINIRQKISQILGYPDHSHFVLEEKMAKSPEKVFSFLDSLSQKLGPLIANERHALTSMKQEDVGTKTILQPWDYHFYNRLVEEKIGVSESAISEFFELERVTKEMLAIYEQVLCLKFVQVENHPSTWHPDVQLYKVVDNRHRAIAQVGDHPQTQAGSMDSADPPVVGYFYLDLFPRPGKYSHAACFPIQPAFVLGDGQYQKPMAVMVTNFTKPTSSAPSLLKHGEVITYFHELGHVMHHICSLTPYSRFHGTSVEGDFVEAPSQMLENWCWNKGILGKMASHYKTGSPLDEQVIANLLKTRNLNNGFQYQRQIFFGLFDMTIHTISERHKEWDSKSLTSFWKALRERLTGFRESEETFGGATFGHLMGGYDAGYYGYLWSLVISADMFRGRFEKEGVLSPIPGMSYRDEILLPGASRDAEEMTANFLGRPVSQDAFLKSIGLE